jgi:chaperonin GroEL (HSP60 family)
LVLEEADRSLHDALCVIRCLVQRPFLIAGGGAPEIELSRQLREWAKTLPGMEQYCVKAFAEAMEVRIQQRWRVDVVLCNSTTFTTALPVVTLLVTQEY